MKILHIVTSIENKSAGPSYSVPSLCKALIRNGCSIKLLCLGNDDSNKEDIDFDVEFFPRTGFFGKRLASVLGSSLPMKNRIKDLAGEYDLIHSHMLWKMPNIYPGEICKNSRVPLVISPRGTLSKWALKHNNWKKQLSMLIGQKNTLEIASMFHVTAESEKNDVIEFGLNPSMFSVVPNGIDIPDLITKDKKKRVVFLSRIHQKKGIDILIKAWGNIFREYKDWELAIVGPDDGEYARQLKNLVEKSEVGNITFTGKIYGEEKNHFLQESSLFVLPTHSENFGMVVAESLANRTPVICSKGAPWQGLIENECGWWIENNQEQLETTLKTALSLPLSDLEVMGNRGRDWMVEDFSWDRVAKKMKADYEQLIAKQRMNYEQ